MTEDELQVVPGKRHKMRFGLLTEPLTVDHGRIFPVRQKNEDGVHMWTLSGKYHLNGQQSGFDLVAVVEDEE